MPKMRTHSGAKARIKVTGSGRMRRRKAFRGHILEKKSPARKRSLGRETEVSDGQAKRIRKLMGI